MLDLVKVKVAYRFTFVGEATRWPADEEGMNSAAVAAAKRILRRARKETRRTPDCRARPFPDGPDTWHESRDFMA